MDHRVGVGTLVDLAAGLRGAPGAMFPQGRESRVSPRNTPERLTFSGFELHPAKRELWRSGQPIALEPKALDLLCYLIEHRERVVSKRELLEQIWPDAVVVESALTRLVSVLRKALSGVPDCIRNVPRAGYRFVATVALSAADARGTAGARQSGFPFVGRAEPLARLAAAWSDAVKSRGRLVLLTGPAGIGKTRLAHEFESRALAGGVSLRGALGPGRGRRARQWGRGSERVSVRGPRRAAGAPRCGLERRGQVARSARAAHRSGRDRQDAPRARVRVARAGRRRVP